MSSINGIDPIIVDTVKVPTQRPAVLETQRTKVNQDKKNKEKDKKNSRNNKEYTQQSLIIAVDKLNTLLENNQIPLYFQIIYGTSGTIIQLMNAVTHDLITKVTAEKIFQLVNEFNTRGFTIDELI